MFRRSFIEEFFWFIAGIVSLLMMCHPGVADDSFMLTVYTSDGCRPCDKWKAEALPTLKTVKELSITIKHNVPGASTPSFVVKHGEKTSRAWLGYSNWSRHRQRLVNAIAEVLGVPADEVLTACRPGAAHSYRPIFLTPIRSMLWRLFRPVAYMPIRKPKPYIYTPPPQIYQPPSVIYYR